MTAIAQNFDTYSGDDAAPIFTVTDGSGNSIDLSAANEVEWIAYKDDSLASVLSKKKTLSQITILSNGGKNNQIQVTILNGDSNALDGWYFHSVVVTDATNKKTTVALGMWFVIQRGQL